MMITFLIILSSVETYKTLKLTVLEHFQKVSNNSISVSKSKASKKLTQKICLLNHPKKSLKNHPKIDRKIIKNHSKCQLIYVGHCLSSQAHKQFLDSKSSASPASRPVVSFKKYSLSNPECSMTLIKNLNVKNIH